MGKFDGTRRKLIVAAGTGLLAVGVPVIVTGGEAPGRHKAKPKSEKKEEVTPPEDLMREHGVLDRVLLLYEAAIQKFAAKEDFDPALVTQSGEIVHDFIHNYHEKSEETAV